MGTPEFAVNSLQVVAGSRHEVVGVLTAPDKPRGRGHKVFFSPIKEKALDLKIPVFQPEKLHTKEFKDILDELKPDLIITVCCSHYIHKWIREYPLYGAINLHPSLLPLYRGCLPINEPIIRGDKSTGVTIFYLDKGWDTGDIILQREIPIEPGETGGSLHDKLSLLGSELLAETLDLIEKGNAPRILQDHSRASYTDKICPGDGEIDWSFPAINIERKIRAFNPVPGSFTFYKDIKLKIWEAAVLSDEEDFIPGKVILASDRKGFVVGTGKGLLEILILQMPSRKKTGSKDFLRGYTIEEGIILGRKTDEI